MSLMPFILFEVRGCVSISGSGSPMKTLTFLRHLCHQTRKEMDFRSNALRTSSWAVHTASVPAVCPQTPMDTAHSLQLTIGSALLGARRRWGVALTLAHNTLPERGRTARAPAARPPCQRHTRRGKEESQQGGRGQPPEAPRPALCPWCRLAGITLPSVWFPSHSMHPVSRALLWGTLGSVRTQAQSVMGPANWLHVRLCISWSLPRRKACVRTLGLQGLF